jgi:hypothetical protein
MQPAAHGELNIRDAEPDDLPRLQQFYHHLTPDDAMCPPDEAVVVPSVSCFFPAARS